MFKQIYRKIHGRAPSFVTEKRGVSLRNPYLCHMLRWKAVRHLLYWEYEMEYRRSNGWFLPVLFTAIVGFLCSLVVRDPSPTTWLALLWITIVFSALQSAARAFAATDAEWLYMNQLVRPGELLLGKALTNTMNTLVVTWTGLLLFHLWLGWPAQGPAEGSTIALNTGFIISISLGAVAIASTLSFTAALASKIQRGTSLMAILSLPLLLPTLLVAMRASKLALLGEPWILLYPNWIGEIVLCALPISLGALLFPYLWRA
jgi:heme exporter protein B